MVIHCASLASSSPGPAAPGWYNYSGLRADAADLLVRRALRHAEGRRANSTVALDCVRRISIHPPILIDAARHMHQVAQPRRAERCYSSDSACDGTKMPLTGGRGTMAIAHDDVDLQRIDAQVE